MRHAVVDHSIFVDECGFNIWTARSHGQARLGEKAYGQICGQFSIYMFFILYLLQQKDCAKNNNLNDNVHTLVFLFSILKYM